MSVSGSRTPRLIAAMFALVMVVAACTGGGDSEERSAALDEWLRGFYGIEQWQDFHDEQPGHHWQRTVENVEVSGSAATVTLGMHPGNPDTPRLGQEAATTIVQQIRVNDPEPADRVREVRVKDAGGTIVATERR